MTTPEPASPATGSLPAWAATGITGLALPALAVLALAGAPGGTGVIGGPVLAAGMMGAAMIGAAASGTLRTGIGLGLLAGAAVIGLASLLGLPVHDYLLSTALAALIAALSFAARGALFARSGGARGWWIALAVVGGEAAMLAVAAAEPGALPGELLVLLPAQWASAALGQALAGGDALAASSELIALAGTAAATLLVAQLWPRRWPYLVMFTTWIALSALVWHFPAAT
jgi:hypothetical protein